MEIEYEDQHGRGHRDERTDRYKKDEYREQRGYDRREQEESDREQMRQYDQRRQRRPSDIERRFR